MKQIALSPGWKGKTSIPLEYSFMMTYRSVLFETDDFNLSMLMFLNVHSRSFLYIEFLFFQERFEGLRNSKSDSDPRRPEGKYLTQVRNLEKQQQFC